MTVGSSGSHDSTSALTSFAADLTDAAYTVVLRHGIGGSWIDLQLDVWRVLAVSIAQVQRRSSRLVSAAEFLDWRETLVSELTDAAYRTALRHGVQGPFVDIDLELHVAVREAVERARARRGLAFLLAPGALALADAVLSRLEHQADHSAGLDACRR